MQMPKRRAEMPEMRIFAGVCEIWKVEAGIERHKLRVMNV